MEAGLVRDDFSAEHLVWELLALVAYVRLLYLHGRATEEERSSVGQICRRPWSLTICRNLEPAYLGRFLNDHRNPLPHPYAHSR